MKRNKDEEMNKGQAVQESAETTGDGTGVDNADISQSDDLKLYTLYTPPEHKDRTVHPTKADEQEEHFDGKVSE